MVTKTDGRSDLADSERNERRKKKTLRTPLKTDTHGSIPRVALECSSPEEISGVILKQWLNCEKDSRQKQLADESDGQTRRNIPFFVEMPTFSLWKMLVGFFLGKQIGV